ncbi:MAG: deoxyhypusine synthase family protein, partial [Nitrososphaerales archaeon]
MINNDRSKSIKNYDIIDYEIKKNDLKEIISQMSYSGGFESTNLTKAINITRKMIGDSQCTRFLSFVGAIISTGARGIIKDMIKRNMFDCIITTCGALDHDVAKTFGKYYAGEFNIDDSYLKKRNIHRLGNVFIPTKNYGPLIENKVQHFLLEYYDKHKEVSGHEIVDYIGSKLDDNSFLYWAHKNKIPVIVPGLVDGAVGSQIWLFYQQHKDFVLNLLKDQSRISDLIFDAKKTGALMLGGGISKHHTLWW